MQDFAGLQYDELLAKLYADLSAQYDTKFGKIPREQAHEIQRVIFLQILDEIWREHLYQMDILKTGIGLRGYNQKDPLVEYKKESFLMFSDLVERVKNSVIKTLHTIEFAYQDEQEQIEQMKTARANEDLAMQRSIDAPKQAPKIPRNAPCPCGSGKKYKACCGKSGPKKGILAK